VNPEQDRGKPGWPTGPQESPGQVHFRHVPPDGTSSTSRLGHWRLFLLLLIVLGVASTALVITSVILQPQPPKPCHNLFRCGGGPGLHQLVNSGHTYTSSEYGFSLEYTVTSGVQISPAGIIIQYDSNGSTEQGQVQIVGTPADGMSAAEVVAAVRQSLDPNAEPEYQVPSPFVGFQLGSGEAFNYVINGSSNSQALGRMIILAAVKSNLAIVVVDTGPYVQFSNSNSTVMNINDHPSPADQFAALAADPVVNSVQWPPGRSGG
jgi:hypothetical protein